MNRAQRVLAVVGGACAASTAAGQAINPFVSIAGKDELWNDRGKVAAVDYKFNPGDSIETLYTGIELGYTGSGVGDVNDDGRQDFAATYYWHDYEFSHTDRRVLNDPATEYELPWPYHNDTVPRTFPAGDVRVFGHDGTGIAQIGGNLRHREPIYAGRFAHIIRGRADVDGDGRDDIIAGSGVTGGVSVWAFTDRYTGTEEWVQLLNIQQPQTCHDRASTYNYIDGVGDPTTLHEGGIQRFGWTVAECTDMNGDGSPDVIIGARGYDEFHPLLRGSGISGETPSDYDPKSEGAVLVYCLPPQSWWNKFRTTYMDGGNPVPAGEYWPDHVRDKHIHSTNGYDGEALVYINGVNSDIYYNIRITDPSYTHADLTPSTNAEHKSYLSANERQWEFGSCVRIADDLDGDTSPDILATGPTSLVDHDDDPETNGLRNGKVYAYFSSSGVRDDDDTPTNSFDGLAPLIHGIWEHENGERLNPPSTAGEQLDILIGDADLIIVGPEPAGTNVHTGVDSLTEGITEVMPYNDDNLDDLIVNCQSKLDGNTYNGFAGFFEIEKRVKALTSNGTDYPTTPIEWQIPHDRTYAADSSGLYPDRYLTIDSGHLFGVAMAGNADNLGKCDIRMSTLNGTNDMDFLCVYNPYRVRDGLVGNFESVWQFCNEPTSYSAPSCGDPADHDDGVTHDSVSYPMLEPYEYALQSGTVSDEVAEGGVSKDMSRWWWTGDVDGDTFSDLLAAAWFYPAMYEDESGDIICDPVDSDPDTGIDLFRAGKIYLFTSPFDVTNNGDDVDTDGVNDAVDACVSTGDINEDGHVTSADFGPLVAKLGAYDGYSQSSNPVEYALNRVADVDRDGTIESGDDFNAWVAILSSNPCP